LEQHGIDLATLEPRIQKKQHEGEDREVRPGERIRPGDVNCREIFSHQMPPILMSRAPAPIALSRLLRSWALSRRRNRKRKRYSRAIVWCGPQTATMILDDGATYREAYSHTFFFSCVESLK